MDLSRISELLSPFVSAPLAEEQLEAVSAYVDLLLRWNARLNLTAIRDAESIVTRHIGESLFAAQCLLRPDAAISVIDVGSGPGFPGLPLKICAPQISLTLIESQHKKATFLKEVIRALHMTDATVFAGRAETFAGRADLVTLRAVERFEQILPVAASLLRAWDGVGDAPRLGLLVGDAQVPKAGQILPDFGWKAPVSIPLSSARVVLMGSLRV